MSDIPPRPQPIETEVSSAPGKTERNIPLTHSEKKSYKKTKRTIQIFKIEKYRAILAYLNRLKLMRSSLVHLR